ncbi:MAG: FAD-dependent oxidoreductase [Castellaniella sp.]
MDIQHIRDNPPSSTPYWWEATPRPELTQEPLPEQVDIAIVGSGYAGLSAAISAAKAGASVLVIESGRIGEGASTRNGGAVGESLRLSYSGMLRKYGKEHANRFYDATRDAHRYLRQLIAEHNIDCDYRITGRLMAAHNPADYESLAADLEIRRREREYEAQMIPRSELRNIIGTDAYHGGRYTPGEGNIDPGKWHQGLFMAARGLGVQFADQTPVTGVHNTHAPSHAPFQVRTTRGPVRARSVIMAINAYTGAVDRWLARRIVPVQSQIIATEPLPPDLAERLIPQNRQMGDTRNLHNYFRRSPDGRRILFGGRAGATEINDIVQRTMALRGQMISVFPELESAAITHSWAGFVAYTFDVTPHITTHRGIHYVGGCCGSGVVMMPYLGHKVAMKALGMDAEAETPFDRRYRYVPGYFGKPWFMPAIMKYFAYQDGRSGR